MSIGLLVLQLMVNFKMTLREINRDADFATELTQILKTYLVDTNSDVYNT
jgi:hypothetical protein